MSSNLFRRISVTLASVAIVLGLSHDNGPRLGAAEEKSTTVVHQVSDALVSKLVQQLGADQFATREKAQAELERLGLFAFDALQSAQHHDDIEIAMRARYLLRVMPIGWSREGDTPEIRNILKGYGEQSEEERRSRMDKLAGLAGNSSVLALCRLARFETSNLLAKRAALLAMNATLPETAAARSELGQAVTTVAGLSQRTSAQWLRAFGQTLGNPAASLAEWQRLTDLELETHRQTPEQTTPEIVRDVLRWHADTLRGLNRQEESLVAVRRMLGLLEQDEDKLLESVDWLLERKYWSVVADMAKKFREDFAESTLLSYRLAESQRRQGNEKAAQAVAEQAFRIELDAADKNIRAGMDLEDRGMFDWAEREMRHATKIVNIDTAEHVRARFRLSEMFHDMGKDWDAAQVLQELIDAIEKDPNLEQRIEGTAIRDPNAFRARMHYFYSQHFLEKREIKKHQEHLEKALAADPKDADVLIAMYRVPNPTDEWADKTKKLIWEAARGFHDDVDKFERVVNEQDERTRGEVGGYLAMLCNQYAWLVGNTEGDYEEARRCSHKSLELRPGEAGYMDTLGRCYYAKKDFENAVKYQAMAAKKKPHSGQILRQLQLFEKSLADARTAAEKNDAAK